MSEDDWSKGNLRKRLEDARLRGHAKIILNDWLERLASACNCPVQEDDLLTLEQTQSLKDAFYDFLRGRVPAALWPNSRAPDMYAYVRKLAPRVGSKEAVLFSADDKYIGAVAVKADAILLQAEEVLEDRKGRLYAGLRGP